MAQACSVSSRSVSIFRLFLLGGRKKRVFRLTWHEKFHRLMKNHSDTFEYFLSTIIVK